MHHGDIELPNKNVEMLSLTAGRAVFADVAFGQVSYCHGWKKEKHSLKIRWFKKQTM